MKFKGDYSDVSKQFKEFRPSYPLELYEFILTLVRNKNTAWDSGTGNGQVAYSLSKYFDKIIATDISQSQIDNSYKASNIDYIVCKSEESGISDKSIDLITSAQAIHWFDIEKFYKEVTRVAKNDGIIAIWGYSKYRIEKAVDDIMDNFFSEYLEKYWQDLPRILLSDKYNSLPFVFNEIQSPDFEIKVNWKLSHLEGYLETMSSVQEYTKAHKQDPVPDLMIDLQKVWQSENFKQVTFPVFMRVGKIYD